MTDFRVPILVVFLASSLAAVTDLHRFKVPSWLTLPLLVSGLIYHATNAGLPGLGWSTAAAAFGFVALILPYVAGGMGAGDVKLMAGVGAWLGLGLTYDVLIATALAGGVFAILLAVATGRVHETWSDVKRLLARGFSRAEESVQQVLSQPDRRRRAVPYAAMVAAGLIATVARL